MEETPEECVRRELFEQTGIRITPDDTFVTHMRSSRGTHVHVSYILILNYVPVLRERGSKGENVAIFKASEILNMSDFFPNHRTLYEKALRETSLVLEHS